MSVLGNFFSRLSGLPTPEQMQQDLERAKAARGGAAPAPADAQAAPPDGSGGFVPPTPEQMRSAVAGNNLRTGRATPYDQPPQQMVSAIDGQPQPPDWLAPPVMPAAASPQAPTPPALHMPAQGTGWNGIGPGYSEGVGVNGRVQQTPSQPGEFSLERAPSGGAIDPATFRQTIINGSQPPQVTVGGIPVPQGGAAMPPGPGADPMGGFNQFLGQQGLTPYQRSDPGIRAQMLQQYGALDQISSGNQKLDIERADLAQRGQLARADQALREKLGLGSQGIQQGELKLKQDIFAEGKSPSSQIADLQAKNPALAESDIVKAVQARQGAIGLLGGKLPPDMQGHAQQPSAYAQLVKAADAARPGAGTDLTNQLTNAGPDYMKAFAALHGTLGDEGVQANQQVIRAYLNSQAPGGEEAIRSAITPGIGTRLLDVGGLIGHRTNRPVGDSLSAAFGLNTRQVQRSDLLRRLYGL